MFLVDSGRYSLKDYLALRRDQGKSLSRGAVKNISKAIILVVAGLHAKGLVHLDLKPENLMMFNGRLKLIDVDGCVPCGSEVSIQDSSISFSPCYCAPEWARFLIEETESKITVRPHLDVWSVGMTICELATLDAVLKPMYANFLRNGHSHREAGFLFMDWLGSIAKAPIPKSIERSSPRILSVAKRVARFDPAFHQMLIGSLLVCDHTKRKTLAQCLSDSYLESDKEKVAKDASAVEHSHSEAPPLPVHEKVDRTTRNRIEDTSSKAPLYKGTLWKLNTDGNPQDPTHWLKRDMWAAASSGREAKRRQCMEGFRTLKGATVTANAAKGHRFWFFSDVTFPFSY
ncbi:STE20 [Symbiodinium necroappetens]|uniref:STE20 protein n=1 Tax=Symbiodinium necroappetens TaxID=1628268 RepID=A0A812WS35_9DINO|nr:STE20 [Symbiodinium necroappetens]